MNTSRRNFIKIGTVAGVVAGANLLAPAFSKAQSRFNDAPEIPREVFSEPLYSLKAADFKKYIGAEFTMLAAATGSTVAVLKSVAQTPSAVKTVRRFGDTIRRKTRGENFVLSFTLPASDFPQATYQMWHPNLGPFDLFLVPGGKGENNENLFHAVFNRI